MFFRAKFYIFVRVFPFREFLHVPENVALGMCGDEGDVFVLGPPDRG